MSYCRARCPKFAIVFEKRQVLSNNSNDGAGMAHRSTWKENT